MTSATYVATEDLADKLVNGRVIPLRRILPNGCALHSHLCFMLLYERTLMCKLQMKKDVLHTDILSLKTKVGYYSYYDKISQKLTEVHSRFTSYLSNMVPCNAYSAC